MAAVATIELHALGQEVASGSGSSVDITAILPAAPRSALKLYLNVTEVNGEAQVSIETSPNGTAWRQAGVFERFSTPGSWERHFFELDPFVRATWSPGTDVTFQLSGEAHQVYATKGDVFGLYDQSVFRQPSQDEFAKALIDASSDGESACHGNYPLPITKWPSSFRRRVATIAAKLLICKKGIRPESSDEILVDDEKSAQKWLENLHKLRPAGFEPTDVEVIRSSSGNPRCPNDYQPRFSDDWGDFG